MIPRPATFRRIQYNDEDPKGAFYSGKPATLLRPRSVVKGSQTVKFAKVRALGAL